MKICEKADFSSRKFTVSTSFEKDIKHRVCPDIIETDSNYVVKNLYDDVKERKAFSIQILKCKNTKKITCKSDPDIQKVLEKL